MFVQEDEKRINEKCGWQKKPRIKENKEREGKKMKKDGFKKRRDVSNVR